MIGLCSFAMQCRSVRGRLTATLILCRLAAPTVIALTALILVNSVSTEALARGRSHHRGRSSAAAAAARKKQMIQSIQNQVAVARQVLAAAESQTAMSEQELGAVRERLVAARSEIEAAGSEERKAREELREIESSILSDQGPESPSGKAQAAVDEAQQALDRQLHRLVSLPEHAAELTAADRSADARLLSASDRGTVRNDAQYQSALGRLTSAKRDFAQIRDDLLKRTPEWIAASKAVAEAHQKESKLKQDGNTGAIRSMPAKRNLRTAQDVAAAARATVVQGEAMLRQLGVKNVGNASRQAQANASKPKK